MRRTNFAARVLLTLVPLLASRAVAARDLNANGLADEQEERVLARFAPVVLLAPGERALPANVDWFLARAHLDSPAGDRPGRGAERGGSARALREAAGGQAEGPRVTQAALIGDWKAALDAVGRQLALIGDWEAALGAVGREVARLRPNIAARDGSGSPRDWIVYGHVYPGQDGGLLVQYWFFYPFNRSYVLFDHEGDWEHVTVRLDARQRPLGAWYARHVWSAPGKWFSWEELEREGEHPVVLSARGSHASYADARDVLWWDSACPTRVPGEAGGAGCRVWRTWEQGTGGIVNTGPRDRPQPRASFLSWPGLWGTLGWFKRDTGGPPGPAYQAGWCSGGAPGCG